LSRPIIARPRVITLSLVNHGSQVTTTVFCNKIGTSLTNRERLLVSQGLTTVVYDVRPINRDDRLASSLASMQPSRQPWCHRLAGIDRRRLVR